MILTHSDPNAVMAGFFLFFLMSACLSAYFTLRRGR